MSSINYNNFRVGKRCGCKLIGLSRTSEDEIKQVLEKRGCKYLSSTYDGKNHNLIYICKCGYRKNTTLQGLKKSNRCHNCVGKTLALSYSEVKLYFESQKCELLETDYINARTKMKYICSCGNKTSIVFDSFKRGNRCQKCRNKKNSEMMKGLRVGEKNPGWIKDRDAKKAYTKFRNRCSNMVRNCFRLVLKEKKSKRTEEILGYKIVDLKLHLESHPNWDRVKNSNWEIDHIFPIKAFVDYGIKDIKLINSLDNLQPLTESENSHKRAKYNRQDFEKWLKNKDILYS